MEQETLYQAFVALLPVIAGGAIGVLGGLVGTHYGHRLTEGSTKRTDKRVRVEALASATYELDLWLRKEENYFLYKGPENLEHSPLARVETLVLLYFPEMTAEGRSLSTTVREYRTWMMEGRKQVLDGNLSIPPPEHTARFGAVYKSFLDAREALLERAQGVMRGLMAS
ncbi:MAG: hypothetical protein CVU15_10260 [Betaproteobacteria bacterium HGW-Betaproteobacteria-1]|jgi:hypothetical protein|nr:MAG: hypothetical protein CVU15_10260 [Betaproteobacteria bacterium HGW-Betaproteobacteria-1]